jgi:hypothetical protein
VKKIVPLADFIPALSPRFKRPVHLMPVIERLSRALVEPLRLVITIPVRHGKTELLLHAMIWWLLQRPDAQIMYASYAAAVAHRKAGRKGLRLARRAGVELDESSCARGDWRTGADDGGVLSFGIDGQATGDGADVVVIDDPLRGRAAAESSLVRDRTCEAINDDLFTRLEPHGSIILCQAAWHEDDPGRRLIRRGWEHVHLPAIDANGQALWPERYPIERLRETEEQLGAYTFESLYQGRPLPRSGSLFRDCHFYDELPARFRIGKGIDAAYTERTRADASAAVVIYEHDGLYYVVCVRTARVQTPEFLEILADLDREYPGPWPLVERHRKIVERAVALLAAQRKLEILAGELGVSDPLPEACLGRHTWSPDRIVNVVRHRLGDAITLDASAVEAHQLLMPLVIS